MKPNHADPLDPAITSLASARWMREPDWPSMKEKLVKTPRFQFARRRPVLFGALVIVSLCAGAAAVTRIYESFHFAGVMQLDDGSTAQVQGEAVIEGGQTSVTVNAQAPDGASGAGSMDVTLPNGQVAHVIAVPADGSAKKPANQPK